MRSAAVALGVIVGALLGPSLVLAQESGSVEFRFETQSTTVHRLGERLELLPVLALVGAEAGYSPAAGTYGVVLGNHFIQFAVERQTVLADDTLIDLGEKPVASPGGLAASAGFLERALLAPLGFHLEPIPGGYRIEKGSVVVEPVTVRPAAADFASTTTLVLALSRPVQAQVVGEEGGRAVVRFDGAAPQLDPSVPLGSPRVRAVVASGRELRVEVAHGVGLLSWHVLNDPPRIILELGRVRAAPAPAPQQVVERPAAAAIVIDPGHGGDDTGAIAGSGLREKDVVLAIARRLQGILASRGLVVRLTRDGDEGRALSDRTALANRLEARVFVSLHANASTVAAVRGAETYYMSLDKKGSDEAAAATASAENRAGQAAEARSPLALILWDLAQSEVLNESARLALAVQTRLNERLALADRGVKQAPFVVLTGATMPAVLVEVGFLSNPDEQQLLQDPAYQQRLAEAIAAGVEEFLGKS